MLQCGLVRENFSLAMALVPNVCQADIQRGRSLSGFPRNFKSQIALKVARSRDASQPDLRP
jgi:hypothetical protein